MNHGFVSDAEHKITIAVNGSSQNIYIDGVKALSFTDNTYQSGSVGYISKASASTSFGDLLGEKH